MERNARGLVVSNNLWQKIENRNNNRKAYAGLNNNDTSLYRAILADKTPTNNNTQDIMGGINEGLKGLGTLAGTLKNNTGSNNSDWGSITNEASKLFNNNGTSSNSLGGLFNNSFETAGNNALENPDNFLGFMNGGSGGGYNAGGWLSLIPNAFNAGKTAFDGGSWSDDVPQSFFGIDSKNDSDVMQAFKGAGQGASMGTAIYPGIGTAIGAVLGLGASFLDDI